MPSSKTSREAQRVLALRRYHVLDSGDERSFDDILALASFICGKPVAYVSFADQDPDWARAEGDPEHAKAPRDVAFCVQTARGRQLLVVEDARAEASPDDNPAPPSAARVQVYAAGRGGSVAAARPASSELTAEQSAALRVLARQVLALLDLRLASADLARAIESVRTLEELLPICAYCKKVRDDRGYWNAVEQYVAARTDAQFSHGICPACAAKHFPEAATVAAGSKAQKKRANRRQKE